MDHDIVADQPSLGVAGPRDPAVGDEAPGSGPELRDFEGLANLSGSQLHFLDDRIEEADHGILDFVGDVVDDRMQPDLDLFVGGDAARVAVRPDVEPDDDRVGGGRQKDVGLIDATNPPVNNSNLDSLVAELGKRLGQYLGGPLHVRLDDEGELFHPAFGDLLLQRFEG